MYEEGGGRGSPAFSIAVWLEPSAAVAVCGLKFGINCESIPVVLIFFFFLIACIMYIGDSGKYFLLAG